MKFKTPVYEGAWIPFDGDRKSFRLEVEKFLKQSLADDSGKLLVDDHGPHWIGKEAIAGLSYANTINWGVVVFSRSYVIGVDLEKADRLLKKIIWNWPKDFFIYLSMNRSKKESIFDGAAKFLELWMKKEAYSKMKREHLVKSINVAISNDARFEILMKIRDGYRAIVAIS